MYFRRTPVSNFKNILNNALYFKLSPNLVLSSQAINRNLDAIKPRYFHTLSNSNKAEGKKIELKQQEYKQLLRRHLRTRSVTVLPEIFKMEWPKITLFGDSITRRSMDPDNGCWGSFIAHHVGGFMNVDPRGFEGYNSRWGLSLMPKLFPKSYLDKVEIFIPFFGHNDVWKEPYPAHVPVEEFESNMRGIVNYLIDNGLGKEKIILITPTWYHDKSFQVYLKEIKMPPLSKDLESAREYTDVILRIATEMDITVLDFFEISLKQEPLEEIFCDGIHYSRKGARLMYQNLIPLIEKKVESTYKKRFVDLWHVTPLEERDEIKPLLTAFREALKEQ